MSLLSTQLSRHSSLKPIDRQVMYARHPARVNADGKRYVPTVHQDPINGASVFIYPFNRHGYADRMLADGMTIEYHPSRSADVNGDLRALVGREVALYAQCGRRECRQGRVRVHVAPEASDVYHLRLVRPPPSPQKQHVLWADMD